MSEKEGRDAPLITKARLGHQSRKGKVMLSKKDKERRRRKRERKNLTEEEIETK